MGRPARCPRRPFERRALGRRAFAAALLFACAARAGCQEQAEPLFRFPVEGVVTAGPVVSGSRVWALSDSRTLFTLTVEGVATGKRVLPSRRAAFIACDAFGRAVISDGPSALVLVNKAGQEAWRVDLGAVPARPPLFAADGRLYVAFESGLAAYAPNGRRLWFVSLGAPPSSDLALGPGGGPLLGLSDGGLALYGPDGQQLAALAAGSAPVAVAATSRSCVAALADGRALALGPRLEPLSDRSLGSRPLAAAASGDGLYALGAGGTLLALSPDGSERWRTSVPLGGATATLAAFEERAVVLSASAVRSYGPDGSLYRQLGLRGSATPPAIAESGSVLVGGSDWILYAYRFERRLVAAPAPEPAPLDLAAVDAAAEEEARWSPRPFDDDEALARLADIEKKIKTGTIGAEAGEASRYAAAVALGRMGAPFGSGVSSRGPTPVGALPRARACEVLGSLGLAGAVPVLGEVFARDPDPAVRASAAMAVAEIGLDPEGRALGAFAAAAERRLDERTALAVIEAIDRLYRASGALNDTAGALALLRLAGGAYPADIRDRARKALARVSKP